MFSNHFQGVGVFGVASESFAWVQVDHNVFEAFEPMATPVTTMYQDPNPGTMTETTNRFPAGTVVDVIRPTSPVPQLPYGYSPDSTDSVSTIVSACAGTAKITF